MKRILTYLFMTVVLTLAMSTIALADDFVDSNDPTVPHIGFDYGWFEYTKEKAESSYDGTNLFFYLLDNNGESYDPGGNLAKLKNGKEHDMSNIIRCESSDTSVAEIKRVYWDKILEWEEENGICCDLYMTIFKPGNVTITIRDARYGKKLEVLNLKITQKMFINNWEHDLSLDELYYGDTKAIAHGRIGDKVVIKVKGKTYTKTISSNGKAIFKLPLLKPETKGAITYYKKGTAIKSKRTFEIQDIDDGIYLNKVKRSSKKISGTIKRAVKGDKIKIKVGGKTYTKKVKKTAAVLKFSQKVGKLKKGSRVQISVYSKFNKIRFGDTIKVK